MKRIWNEVKDWLSVLMVVTFVLLAYVMGLTITMVAVIYSGIKRCIKDIVFGVKYYHMVVAVVLYRLIKYDDNPKTVCDEAVSYLMKYDGDEVLRHIAGMFKNKPQEMGQQPENVVDFPIDEVTGKRIIGFKGN